MAEKELSKYYIQIDLIKAIAIIFVLIIHATAVILYQSNYLICTLTLNVAVPVFFVLMGRNTGASFKKRGYNSLKPIFSFKYLESRFMRIVFPVIIISLFSIILGILFNQSLYFGILTFIGRMPFEGFGGGWGNYFISIIIQFIFLFPFLYILYLKSPKTMLILSFIINFLFELFASTSSVFYDNSYLYKASIFRYLFVISLGLWVMDKIDDNMGIWEFLLKYKLVLVGFIVSFTYLLIHVLKGWVFPYFLSSWPQNIFSAFYPLILCVIGIIYLPKGSSNRILDFIAYIGKASYHIFLVQILYFAAITPFILKNNFIYGYISPLFTIILIIVNFVISLALGLVFFHLEPIIANKIIHLQFKDHINNVWRKINEKLIRKAE